MTETGQVPGEGVPENAGGQQETPQFAVPHAPAGPGLPEESGDMSSPGAYAFHESAQSGTEEDDLLLMPGAQGAWSEHPQPQHQMYAQGQPPAVPPQPSAHEQAHQHAPVQHAAEVDAHRVGTHETGGRDTGSVDYSATRTAAQTDPQPTATQAASPASAAPTRRPLHLGPPVPESSSGVVRFLADRGPAATPTVASASAVSAAEQPGLYIAGPGYPHVQPREEAMGVPGAAAEQDMPSGEGTPARSAPWEAQQPQEAAPVTPPLPADGSAGGSAETTVGAEDDGATDATGQPLPPVPAPMGETGQAFGYVSGFGIGTPEQPQPGADPGRAPGEAAAEVGPHQPSGQSHPRPEPAAVEHSLQSPESGNRSVAQESPHPNAVDTSGGGAEHGGGLQAPAGTAEAVSPGRPEEGAALSGAASFSPEDGGWQSPDAGTFAEAPWAAPAAEPIAQADEVTAAQESAQAPNETRTRPEPDQRSGTTEPAGVPEAGEAAGPRQSGPAAEPHIVLADAIATRQPAAAGPSEQAAEWASSQGADRGDAAAFDEAARAAAPAFSDAEREAVLRVMRERRDIRNGFRSDPIPNDVLRRVLEAAHTAPSVGHSQPWDFVVIRSAETRRMMHELAMRQREAYAKSLPKGRAKQFRQLKIEAILDTPVNIVITADPTRGGRHTLGRHTQPQMAPYSSALAVENLWLAARAEGLGVGWVSFFDEREMVRALGLPEHLEVVAYLCIGYVDEFPAEPELMQAGWSKRRPLSWVVHEEEYGRRALPGEEPQDLLAETLRGIRPLDAKALGEAWERQKRMTKPAGALGMLEIISAQLCGLSRKCPPPIPEPAAVAVFAGDHGVHAQGVTPWPQEVTAQMVANFLAGGAVCNAFAGQVGAEVCVVDVGVVGELPSAPGLLPRKVRPGTGDLTTGPALSREEVLRAIEVGIETARDLVAAGNKALLTGEMGIANTTVSAALISVYTGADPSEVTGRGTGINDETHARKVEVVRRALELHQPDPADPIGVLAAVGGLEHAAIVGLVLGGASLRTPVILDGVSAGAAALVTRAIAPEALAACIAGHRSAEPGHVAALTKLGLRPLVDLDLRLGEGTGALLALPLVQSAARAMHEVATFDSAGVTEKPQ